MVQQTRDNTGRPRRWTKGKYIPKRKVCAFCRDKIATIDYKDAVKLLPFVSDRGKIEPRRRTGTCAKHQRLLSEAIKRARHIALLPYVPEHVRKSGGVGVRIRS
ncbi:MAG: 30S ribosomal protein S18 [Dehalococcoidales bacterium]|nr:30S ribosomal protein S18 [Dehalococcoidales bacterium]